MNKLCLFRYLKQSLIACYIRGVNLKERFKKERGNLKTMRYRKEYNKAYNQTPKRKAYNKRYNAEYNQRPDVKEKHRIKTKLYFKKHPEIKKANNKVRKIKLGLNCLFCNITKRLEKHHSNYDYPLRFITLCIFCHKNLHNNLKAGWS